MVRKNGFVAMLDVLGFSDYVVRDFESHTLDAYVDTVAAIRNKHPSLKLILFSDTVVLYTLNDDDDDFAQMLTACSTLLHALIEKEIPLRGAISHGSFVRSENDTSGTVIAGRPIIEAHQYEAQLQWIGIMIAPSVLRRFPDLRSKVTLGDRPQGTSAEDYFASSQIGGLIQACVEIPVMPYAGIAEKLEGFAVVPTSGEAQNFRGVIHGINECNNHLSRMKPLADLPPIKRSTTRVSFQVKVRKENSHEAEAI